MKLFINLSLIISFLLANVCRAVDEDDARLKKPLSNTALTVSQKAAGDPGKVNFIISNKESRMIYMSVALSIYSGKRWVEVYSDIFEESDAKARVGYTIPKNAEIHGVFDASKILKRLKINQATFRISVKGVGSDKIFISNDIVFRCE